MVAVLASRTTAFQRSPRLESIFLPPKSLGMCWPACSPWAAASPKEAASITDENFIVCRAYIMLLMWYRPGLGVRYVVEGHERRFILQDAGGAEEKEG